MPKRKSSKTTSGDASAKKSNRRQTDLSEFVKFDNDAKPVLSRKMFKKTSSSKEKKPSSVGSPVTPPSTNGKLKHDSPKSASVGKNESDGSKVTSKPVPKGPQLMESDQFMAALTAASEIPKSAAFRRKKRIPQKLPIAAISSAPTAPSNDQIPDSPASPEAAGVLTRSMKKRVRWADGASFVEIRYFEREEFEERAMFNTPSKPKNGRISRISHLDKKMEREQMEAARKEGITIWKLIPVDNTPELIESGFESDEKYIQEERTKGVLMEIYFRLEDIPDSPREPDEMPPGTEMVGRKEPKIIPLEEICG